MRDEIRCRLAATNLFYAAGRLTVALRPYRPSAPVRLRKPASERSEQLQNAARSAPVKAVTRYLLPVTCHQLKCRTKLPAPIPHFPFPHFKHTKRP